jgi:TPR repeat protein
VPQDFTEAAKWYHKAAEQGLSDAQVQYGLAMSNGRGVEKAPTEAIGWLRKAADQKNPRAAFVLAIKIGSGDGVPKDTADRTFHFGNTRVDGQTYRPGGLRAGKFSSGQRDHQRRFSPGT